LPPDPCASQPVQVPKSCAPLSPRGAALSLCLLPPPQLLTLSHGYLLTDPATAPATFHFPPVPLRASAKISPCHPSHRLPNSPISACTPSRPLMPSPSPKPAFPLPVDSPSTAPGLSIPSTASGSTASALLSSISSAPASPPTSAPSPSPFPPIAAKFPRAPSPSRTHTKMPPSGSASSLSNRSWFAILLA